MDSALDSPGARKVSDFANGQVSNFLDSVDDLTKALKDIETPDIARVRAKVKLALAELKTWATKKAAPVVARAALGIGAADSIAPAASRPRS